MLRTERIHFARVNPMLADPFHSMYTWKTPEGDGYKITKRYPGSQWQITADDDRTLTRMDVAIGVPHRYCRTLADVRQTFAEAHQAVTP